ncbi:hypothetical protein GQ53DRAFT_645533 [Thozetella sp. PMI_491]|nr:hypothetical protein GQ53DRAFT_645533 [Thozetella sp. PMI_491]
MATNFELFTALRFDPSLASATSDDFNYVGWNHQNASPLYMLDFHRDRILRAALHWNWIKAVELLDGEAGLKRLADLIISTIGPEETTPQRVKVVVSQDGAVQVEFSPVPQVPLVNLFPEALLEPGKLEGSEQALQLPREEPEYAVILDGHQTAKSEYTHFKTTKRDMYDTAMQRAALSLTDKAEVLLVNSSDGSIMEGSRTTPYLWRTGRWVTPPVSPRFGLHDSGGQDGTTRRWALERAIAVEEEIKADSLVDGEECWVSNGVRGFIFGRIKLT